jgi:hypothetical protein
MGRQSQAGRRFRQRIGYLGKEICMGGKKMGKLYPKKENGKIAKTGQVT